MADSAYWNPKNETMPRADLERLQLAKLRRLAEWAYDNSPFHRSRWDAVGFHPQRLATLDDLRHIPFMTREEWMASISEMPLFGDIPATSAENAIRYHLTSGTSGRTPIRVLDGMKDWEWIAEMWCYGLWAFGVRPRDTVYIAFGYGQFIGFWGLHYACEKIGALVIPGGAQTTEARVKMIMEMGATTVASTPTYALRLWQQAAEMGIDLARDSKVNKLILSGEPAGSIPAVKRQLEEAWGAKCGDTAGMTEVGTIMIFECDRQPGGTHIIEDHYIEEVVDPVSGDPVGYGELGERVVTSFGRGFIPVLRYRTKDMVVRAPHTACSCGRTSDLYDGGIRGRWDDMKLIRGTNVYPRAVEAIVREYDAIDEFQIYIWRSEIRDEITIKFELKPGREAEWPALGDALSRSLAHAHENLRFLVERMEPGTLPRFELKAKRLVDARPVAAYRQ
ncbi:MAG TPA: phenylacetate--CoA ligase family protein [Ktedonobacterales bacterium]|jgi:phenylacetate-CoA ligase|nr:phenylacetate--CoA ligase family protein [Ktedonobacterales bacterium]